MDVLGLLAAVVGVTLFPGGLYACAAAGGVVVGGRMAPPAGTPWTAPTLGAAALLLFAAALVPLPQSPTTALPTPDGAPANLLAALLLLGGGVAVGTAPHWTRTRLAAAAAAALPLLVLIAQAATLSFPVVVSLPGAPLAAGRALAAVSILLAVPVLGRLDDPSTPRGLRALLVAVPALVAAVLLAPPGWSQLPAALAAVMTLAGVILYAAALRAVRRLLRHRDMPLVALAAAAAIGSIVVVARAGR
jgi:hypothetical protein